MKKKNVISPEFTQPRRSCEIPWSPMLITRRVRHTAS